MSGSQRSKLGRNLVPQAKPRTGDRIADAVSDCIDAQAELGRAKELSRKSEERRRQAVRAAFTAGASAAQLSAALKLSRAKIYQLIGSARAIQD